MQTIRFLLNFLQNEIGHQYTRSTHGDRNVYSSCGSSCNGASRLCEGIPSCVPCFPVCNSSPRKPRLHNPEGYSSFFTLRYRNCVTVLIINDSLSCQIRLESSVKQRCPLSPLLFSAYSTVDSFHLYSTEVKVLAYAG